MPGESVLEREMGCTREELLRWLPGAAAHAGARVEGEGLTLSFPAGGRVQVSLHEAPPRRIGVVAIPVLVVRFTFVDLDLARRTEFVARFDAYTRRGGG